MSTEARVSHCKVWPPGQETKPRQVLIVCWATGGDPAANRPTLSQPCHPPRCGQGYCVVPPPCSLETLTGWDSQLLVLQLTILETCPSHPLWEPHFLLPQSLVPSSLLLHLQSGGIFADSTEASGSWSIPYTRPACQHSPPRSHNDAPSKSYSCDSYAGGEQHEAVCKGLAMPQKAMVKSPGTL